MVSVSYTHLDVYKRQVQHLLQHTQGPQFSGTHIAQKGTIVTTMGAPVFLLPAGVAGGAVDPVSYTHLDVYKRQL